MTDPIHAPDTPFPPTLPGSRPVLVVMSDLIFRSKIDEAARRQGLALRAAKSLDQLDRQLAANEPAIAFVDLEAEAPDPAEAIRRIRERSSEGEGVRIVGFAGHTNVAAIQAGRAAGAGVVLARSGLVAQLPALLERVAQGERARAGSAG
jgi:DNA-binding NarL/FixJ family response regulator